MTERRLLLVRHGVTDWNREGRFQGHLDPPLSEDGRVEARLIEIGQGEWEGRTHADLAVSDAERYAAWRRDSGIRQPPGGESIESAAERLTTLVAELTVDGDRWPICLVSHGGTLRILARILLGDAGAAQWSFDVDNASLSVCSMTDRGWRLDRWNDTLHLLGRMATHVDEMEGRPLAL